MPKSILTETQWLYKGYDLLYIWSQKRKLDEKYLCMTKMFLEANTEGIVGLQPLFYLSDKEIAALTFSTC